MAPTIESTVSSTNSALQFVVDPTDRTRTSLPMLNRYAFVLAAALQVGLANPSAAAPTTTLRELHERGGLDHSAYTKSMHAGTNSRPVWEIHAPVVAGKLERFARGLFDRQRPTPPEIAEIIATRIHELYE